MKKLAMLLALVMTCNIFATTSLVSAADGDLFFDFTGAVNGNALNTVPTGWVKSSDSTNANEAKTWTEESGQAAYGTSIGSRNQSGWMYTFNGGITTPTTIEFELYLTKADDTNKTWYSGIQHGMESQNTDYIFFSTGNNVLTFSNNQTFAVTSGRWYKIKIDLFYDNSNATTPIFAKYYVDDTYLGHDRRGAVSALAIRSRGTTQYEWIDNVSFRAYQAPTATPAPVPGAKYYDFNTEEIKANNAAEPTDWAYGSGSATDSMTAIVDAEHEVSLGYKMQSGWMYNIEEGKNTIMEFDMYIADATDTTGELWFMGVQNDRGDSNFFRVAKESGKILFSNGSTYDITSKTWYRMKIDITYTAGEEKPYLAKYYVNGNQVGQSRRAKVNALATRAFGDRPTYAYIDNVSFYHYETYPIGMTVEEKEDTANGYIWALAFSANKDKIASLKATFVAAEDSLEKYVPTAAVSAITGGTTTINVGLWTTKTLTSATFVANNSDAYTDATSVTLTN